MFPNHNSITSYMEAGGRGRENGLLLVSITANKYDIKTNKPEELAGPCQQVLRDDWM